MSASHVKIFKNSNRGVALHIAKNVGQIEIKEGTIPKVTLSDGAHEIIRTIIREQSLGKKTKYSLLIVGFKYKRQKMTGAAAVAPAVPGTGLPTSEEGSVEITLTNEPPDGGDPEDIDIVGTDPEPNTEDDSPELPDSDVLLNT